MDERTKLTGLARYSPRLNLLKRFAESDNPILSISAMYLLRDRTARRIGGYFEFSFLAILPIYHITLALMRVCNKPATTLVVTGFILRIVVYLFGLVLLTLPGWAITRREIDGSLFRSLPVNENEIFSGLLRTQLISFFLPPVIFYLLEFLGPVIYIAFLEIIEPGGDIRLWNAGFLYPMPVSARILMFIASIFFLYYFAIFSIGPSIENRQIGTFMIMILAGCFIYIPVVIGFLFIPILGIVGPVYLAFLIPFIRQAINASKVAIMNKILPQN